MGQSLSSSSSSEPKITTNRPVIHPPTDGNNNAAQSCPVDHKSREIWLQQAAEQKPAVAHPPAAPPAPAQPEQRSWLSFLWKPAPTPQQPPRSQTAHSASNPRLGTDREVSSIPRGYTDSAPSDPTIPSSSSASHQSPYTSATAPPSPLSPNNQTADPHTSPSGNWIYPSEEMFFNAMRRKSYHPHAADMSTVIPIHNAVNEKTWKDILAWEYGAAPMSSLVCGGPKLVSFSGDSQKMTPRARWNALLGYGRPFDRHDWVVDRCGQRIEYVIDFYTGKRREGDGVGPSFYLDVRPKLNSFEGVRMRIARAIGWTK